MKIMVDVCLLHPPVSFNADLDSVKSYNDIPPLGVLYLASVLEKNNIEVDVIDVLDAHRNLEDVITLIDNNECKILGISATTPQIRSAVKIAKIIKTELNKDITIGIGNCHVSADPALLKRYPYFDFCVIGEGEKTFLDIVLKLLSGKDISGTFIGEPELNLDNIPFPAFHLIDLDRYRKNGLDFYPIIGTRGCYFNCIFCSRPGLDRKVRSRSGNNICDEIELSFDLFKGRYQFQDDAFTSNKSAVIDFCTEIRKRKLDISWDAGGLRFDQIDKQQLDLMVEAGCTGFCLGIESGSERIRNQIIRKGISDHHISEGFTLLKNYPISIQLSLIMGLPTESREDMMLTAKLPRSLFDKGFTNIEIVAITPTVPLPGARIFNEAIRDGLLDPDIIDKWINDELGEDFREGWPIYIPKGISKEELLSIRKKGYLSFYFNPKYLLKRLKKDLFSWKLLKRDLFEALSLIKFGRSRGSFS